jgi:predicted RNase H-like HicB family nuclease
MATFIGLIRKESKSNFGVEFPDFPGCISAGETLDQAVAGAKEALELHIEGILEDAEALPEPKDFSVIRKQSATKGAIPVLIDVLIPRRSKRINITMDEGLLEKVDEVASNRGTTRSGFLAEAVRKAFRE